MCVRALASLVIHLLTPFFFICLSFFFFFTEVPLFFFLLLNHFLKYIRTQANITCFCLLVCFPLFFWYPLLCTFLSNSTLYSPEIRLFIISLHRLFLLLLLCFSCFSCEHIFIFVVFYIPLFFFFSNSLLSLFSV